MGLTVGPVELEPHTCALVVAAGLEKDQAPVHVQQRRHNSPEGSCPHLCRRGCRGNWSPAYLWTVTAADAAKAVPQARRNLRYRRVSIHSNTHTHTHAHTHPVWFVLSWLTFACSLAFFATCLHVVECFSTDAKILVACWYYNWIELKALHHIAPILIQYSHVKVYETNRKITFQGAISFHKRSTVFKNIYWKCVRPDRNKGQVKKQVSC